jgi:hypothetical protein
VKRISVIQKKYIVIEIREGILDDGIDMNKIFTILLYLNYLARYIAEFHTNMNKIKQNYKFKYRFSLILILLSIVLVQWADLICKLFFNFHLVIDFEDILLKPIFAKSFVKSAVIGDFEICNLEFLKYWLEYLKFVWD